MADFAIPDDILEQILKRLDVKVLIRCKSVSRLWKSFISSPHFVKTHLNHSYITDRNNNRIDNRRIYMPHLCCGIMIVDEYLFRPTTFIIGSSNGLVCICTRDAEIVIANPCTGEVKKLPQFHPDFGSLCWSKMCFGFGYDSSGDDYKVVLGFGKGEHQDKTCFHVLGFKSNVWKDIGEVNYRFVSRAGTLCHGALHWVMYPRNKKKEAVILSFDLFQEDFKEIPQPDGDGLYQSLGIANPNPGVASGLPNMCLGFFDECLCIINPYLGPVYIWKMNIYDAKQSWEVVEPYRKLKPQFTHRMKLVHDSDLFYCSPFIRHEFDRYLIVNPTFVPSLVSPHALFAGGQ